MERNVFIQTLGCQANSYDSERVFDLLKVVFGFSRTFYVAESNFLILNTCSVREKSYFKVFSILGKWKILKDKRSDILIAVIGCVAKQLGIVFFKYTPFVDFVVGPQDYAKLPSLITSLAVKKKSQIYVESLAREKFLCYTTALCQSNLFAYVTIMEGCNKFCSYCIVPITRGVEMSRPFDDIIVEIVMLTQKGVKEIILVGQNVNNYQGDFYNGTLSDLSLLIKYVEKIVGVMRIRFLTSHPLNFTKSLMSVYSFSSKLVSHLHLPIQSGSNRILNKMKRCYTVVEYENLVKKLRTIRSGMLISTDIIVGFPGEDDNDFLQTMLLVRKIGFDLSYSFIYSNRPGTEAELFVDEVSVELKKKRLEMLQFLLRANVDLINKELLGSIQRVLVICSFCKSYFFCGFMDSNRYVYFYSKNVGLGNIVYVIINFFKNGIFYGKVM